MQVDDHLACAVAGITADANILINYGITTRNQVLNFSILLHCFFWSLQFHAARLAAQRYTLTYQEPIPIEQLIVNICDRKQGYTQVDYVHFFIFKGTINSMSWAVWWASTVRRIVLMGRFWNLLDFLVNFLILKLFHRVFRLGQKLWLPIVPEWSVRKLRRMEGYRDRCWIISVPPINFAEQFFLIQVRTIRRPNQF